MNSQFPLLDFLNTTYSEEIKMALADFLVDREDAPPQERKSWDSKDRKGCHPVE
jgi:hypothetical protein